MTDAELSELEAKAKDATPGPWACWSTARKILGIDPVDWGLVLANIPEIERPGIIFTANHNLATDAEEEQARKDHTDPGQSGRNAAYVAAVNPDVILSLIAELRRARAEIDWLVSDRAAAKRCLTCPSIPPANVKCEDVRPNEITPCKRCWREAAREAVQRKGNEEQCKN